MYNSFTMINFLKQLIDWIYKKQCYFCHKASDSLMCRDCYEEVELFNPVVTKHIKGINVYCMGTYNENLRKLIRAVKYHNKKELARSLAGFMNTLLENINVKDKKFEIVPVPLYKDREKQRGYNHMLLVAQELSVLTGFPVNDRLITRVKNTRPQYKLTKPERNENMKNAFSVDVEQYNGKSLLILDDLCTTGSTLEEMIREFKKHGITDIHALVAAVPL